MGWRGWTAVCAVWSMGGCIGSYTFLPDNTSVSCGVDDDCPPEWTCRTAIGRCRTRESPAEVPEVVAAALDPAAVSAGTPVTVRLELAQSTLLAEQVALEWDRNPYVRLAENPGVVFSLDEGRRYAQFDERELTLTVTPDENTPEGTFAVVADIVSFEGTWLSDFVIGELTLDFTGPGLADGSVEYTAPPAAGLPPGTTSAATVGSRVDIVLTADEDLGPDTAPVLLVDTGTDPPLSVPHDEVDAASRTVTFRLGAAGATPLDLPDGSYDLSVRWSDALGNQRDNPLPRPLTIATAAPEFQVRQREIVYVHAPAGLVECTDNCEGDLQPDLTLSFPFFVASPAYVSLDGDAHEYCNDPALVAPAPDQLPPCTFAFDNPPRELLEVRLSLDPEGAETVGRLQPSDDGWWPSQSMAPNDSAEVYARGVDRAGNVSSPVRIDGNVLVVSSGYRDGRFTLAATAHHHTTPSLRGDETQRARLSQTLPLSLDPYVDPFSEGGDSVPTVVTTPAWTLRPAVNDPLSRGVCTGAVYDNHAGRAVVLTDDMRPVDFDGRRFEERSLVGPSPSPRRCFGVSFDAVTGQVLAFGGFRDLGSTNETWVLGDNTWTPLVLAPNSALPTARNAMAFAYDPINRRHLMFGGQADATGPLNDLWALSAQGQWSLIDVPGGPSPRAGMDMVYDPARGRMVLAGGLLAGGGLSDEIWEFDVLDDAWSLQGDGYPFTQPPELAYDATRNGVLVAQLEVGGPLNGCDPDGDGIYYKQSVRRYNGNNLVPGGLLGNGIPLGAQACGRQFGGLVALPGGEVLFVGGSSNGTGLDDAEIFREGAWRPVGGGFFSVQPPLPRFSAAVATHPGGITVMFGGAQVGGNGRVISRSDTTWAYNSGGWIPVDTGGPAPRYDAAMAALPDGRVVVVGGRSDDTLNGTHDPVLLDDGVWILNNAFVWENDPAPFPARAGASLVSLDNGAVLLFGGDDGTDPWGDAWIGVDDGPGQPLVWTELGGTLPPARTAAALVYDRGQDHALLIGGRDVPEIATGQSTAIVPHNAIGNECADVWRFNVNTQTFSPVSLSAPCPAPLSSTAAFYDERRGAVALVGGQQDTVDPVANTTAVFRLWELHTDVPRWQEASFISTYTMQYQPLPLFDGHAGYGPDDHTPFVFGGRNAAGLPQGHHWERPAFPLEGARADITLSIPLGDLIGDTDQVAAGEISAGCVGQTIDLAPDPGDNPFPCPDDDTGTYECVYAVTLQAWARSSRTGPLLKDPELGAGAWQDLCVWPASAAETLATQGRTALPPCNPAGDDDAATLSFAGPALAARFVDEGTLSLRCVPTLAAGPQGVAAVSYYGAFGFVFHGDFAD